VGEVWFHQLRTYRCADLSRCVPGTDVSRCSIGAGLLNHLVGELLKVERHVEADRLGGVEIDYEVELC
jgi:hypothetical protein